ncbi:MAG: response regulator, partial [Acholeplasmataceae bacterium]|nr:response regulator [Acholeplasmataceae bacterium]
MAAKILIVDDSATDRLIIKNMLKDYTVLLASDGVEALEVITGHHEVELMILDLNMPRMNGFEVLEALKSDARYQKVRAIILTNYDELENEIRGLKLGAVDYIRKPINLESLKIRIDIHMEMLRLFKLLEKKLRDSTLTLDTILQQAPVGIAISHNSDPGKGFGSETTVVNAVYERITGYSKNEL